MRAYRYLSRSTLLAVVVTVGLVGMDLGALAQVEALPPRLRWSRKSEGS